MISILKLSMIKLKTLGIHFDVLSTSLNEYALCGIGS